MDVSLLVLQSKHISWGALLRSISLNISIMLWKVLIAQNATIKDGKDARKGVEEIAC